MPVFDRFRLDNGLTVLVHRDHSTPVAAVNILYKVGSRDESPDKTGFAHLFEHLMFGGSVHIPQFDEPLQKAGGQNNAFTNNDFTNYYITLPKTHLEVAFWLESDRMLSLAFSPKSLEVQRHVVIEEFKQNYLNQPYGDVFLLLKPLVYKKHPYRWNTIGKEIGHIEKATMEDVKAFYKKFYNPDNAIMCVAGDVQTDEIKQLVEKWFGDIPAGEKLIRSYPQEPEQTEPRTLTVEREVPQDAFYMAWRMPKRTDPEYYTVDLLSDVLSNGNSSRLFRKMVKEKQLLSEVNAFITGDLDGGMFLITGKLYPGVTFEEVERLITEELEKLQNETVPEDELQKVKNKAEANLVFSEISVLNKAMGLCYFEMLGDAGLFNHETEHYLRVTPEMLQKTASTLFDPAKRNVLYYKAKKKS
jgi:predicted Zn-dependent peptidase